MNLTRRNNLKVPDISHIGDAIACATPAIGIYLQTINEILASIAFACSIVWYGLRFYDRFKAKHEDRKNISL